MKIKLGLTDPDKEVIIVMAMTHEYWVEILMECFPEDKIQLLLGNVKMFFVFNKS